MAPKRMERQPNPNDAIGCYALEACAHNPDVLIIDVQRNETTATFKLVVAAAEYVRRS